MSMTHHVVSISNLDLDCAGLRRKRTSFAVCALVCLPPICGTPRGIRLRAQAPRYQPAGKPTWAPTMIATSTSTALGSVS